MADVVLEPAGEPPQGMPTGTAQEPEAPSPIVDEDLPPGEGEEGEPEPPQGRRSLVGDLVREREQRRVAEEQAAAAQGLLQSVMQTPEGLAALQRAAMGEEAPPDQAAEQQALREELEATAIDLGLYDDQGQPDLKSAQRILAREDRRVQQQVQRAVNELRQTELLPLKQQRAEQTIAHVKAVATHYGIDPDMVERGMRTLPIDQLGNPEVQQTVLMTALGLQTFGQGSAPQRPQQAQYGDPQPSGRRALRPPIYQEPSGGRPRGQAPVLDEPFRVRLRESGLKDADIDASLSRFVPGAPNRLE